MTNLSMQFIIVSYMPYAHGLKVIMQYFNGMFYFNTSYNAKYRVFLYQHISDKAAHFEFHNFRLDILHLN